MSKQYILSGSFNNACTEILGNILLNHQKNYDTSDCMHRACKSTDYQINSYACIQHTSDIIKLIGNCFESNGYANDQWSIDDVVKMMGLMNQYGTKGACLKCTMLLGCQIINTFAKNKTYSKCCRIQIDTGKLNVYNQSILLFSQVILGHCVSYPSISYYFMRKTDSYRIIIAHFINTFYYGGIGEYSSEYEMITLTKLVIGKQLICNGFTSNQWKLLIFRQLVLPDLIKSIHGEIKKYFMFKESKLQGSKHSILLIFESWIYLFIFTTLVIHQTNKYMTNQQKEIFVKDMRRLHPHAVRYNDTINGYYNEIIKLYKQYFINKNATNQNDEFVTMFMYSVILLIKKGYFKQSKVFYRTFKGYIQRLRQLRIDLMKCHWINCKNTRKDSNSFKKCSNCKISRYCSKLCQKLDWKYGCHQMTCVMYCIDPYKMQQNRYTDFQTEKTAEWFKTLKNAGLLETLTKELKDQAPDEKVLSSLRITKMCSEYINKKRMESNV